MDKLVSIIMPTYNGSKWLKNAVLSIQSQSYKHWELVLVDDGSIDNTAQIVADLIINEPRIKYFKNEQNLGIQKTLNRGLKEAKGEYIARLDDDDTWIDNEKLEKQVTFLNENKGYVLVGTGVIAVDEEGEEVFRRINPSSDEMIRKVILKKNCFIHSSVVFVKDASMKFGGYSESEDTRHIEDYDLWLKLGTVGKFANLPIYGVRLALRGGSLSAKNRIAQYRKALNIIGRFKNKYPNYFSARLSILAHLNAYRILTSKIFRPVFSRVYKLYKNI